MMDNMNMSDLFGKMMDMQRKMAETQETLAAKSVTADAGGGMVKVTANGLQRVTAIKIDRDAVDVEDVEMLEDLVIAGVNKALDEAAAMAREEMSRAAGGFLPPGMDLTRMGF
jgi:nucleoid-associated protein EbfC